MKFHRYKIDELKRENGRARYWHYMRRFLTLYPKGDKNAIFSGHIETIAEKKAHSLLSIRLHADINGDSRWSGHILIFGVGFFWGHTALKKLAELVTRCSGYKYDDRTWLLRISDGTLWWEIANHSDMCTTQRNEKRNKRRKRRSWREGSINLSIPEAIWGPKRYTYEDIDSFATTIKMPEGEYAVILKLQKQFLGRTKVDKSKHIQTWCIDVDSPRGIPTHYDRSGGWKGDRTHGFGVDFAYPKRQGWKQDAENAVTAWCFAQRGKTGFREPQVEDA